MRNDLLLTAMHHAVAAMMRRDLRTSFRRICWVGDWPPPLPDGPVILYANHHHYYDGHLTWLVATERLGRPSTLWMADYDRFPFFAAVGVQPFPPDDPTRRAATIRRTARRFREAPRTVMVYFPEGELLSPDGGVRDFSSDAAQRIGRLYPDATWWPVAIHVTWWGESSPTALLTGGTPHDAPDGRERERLSELRHSLCTPDPSPLHPLVDGSRGASEIWRLSVTRPFFDRYLDGFFSAPESSTDAGR